MSISINEYSRYRHVKRGSFYVIVGRAKMQIGWETLNAKAAVAAAPEVVADCLEKMSYIAYRSLHDDTLWVRPESEFCDGRFEEIRPRRGYVLMNSSRQYYKNGEGRGWVATEKEATLYSDIDFAARDRTNAFPAEERVNVVEKRATEFLP